MRKTSPIAETDIHGYVDGRLDDARRLAVADGLNAHQEDAGRVADYRLLGERWRETYADVLREPVPRLLLEILAPRSGQQRETGLRYSQIERGERVYYWLDNECGYAITSSDLAEPQRCA